MTTTKATIAAAAIMLFVAACYRPSSVPTSNSVSSIGTIAPAPSDDGNGDLSLQAQEASTAASDDALNPAAVVSELREHTPANDPPPAPARAVQYAPAVPSGRTTFGPQYGPRGRVFGRRW